MQIIERIKNLFSPVQTLEMQENKPTDIILKINGQNINVHVIINKDTIEINTPLNIVINSQLFAVNSQYGVHLNPKTNNVDEMQRTFLNAQRVIE